MSSRGSALLKADLREKYFLTLFPQHSAGSGRDLQGGHKESARREGPCRELQPGSFPKGLELAERWLH